MGIQSKLTIPVIVAYLFFAAILHLYWAPGQLDIAKADYLKQMGREFSALDSSLIRNLLENDYSALYSTLKDLEEFNAGEWKHLSLYNDKGKLIYPLFPKKINSDDPDHHIPYRHDIIFVGEMLGYIELHLDLLKQIERIHQRILILETYFVIIGFVLMLFIIFWQHRIILNPIMNLQKAVNKMINGDFNYQASKIADDEIGQLTHSFLDMREKILTSQNELKQAHIEVQKAFDELAKKNVELHQEVGERRRTQDELNRIASHDELTMLPNRYLLKKLAFKAIAAAKRYNTQVGIMFIDLDEFKSVNDHHSHAAGDLVLVEMSLRISDEIREIDSLGRIGGDEFVVILPNCQSISNLGHIASRITEKIKKPVKSMELDEILGASIGIAVYPSDGEDFDTLLNKADEAMYLAKNAGKNQHRFFSEA